jgi:hypothetical protein
MNTELTIIDNFLPKEIFEKIQNILIGDKCEFPWYYNNTKTSFGSPFDLSNFQFTHTFFDNNIEYSRYYRDLIFPFFEILKPQAVLSVKANLSGVTPAWPEQNHCGFHVDHLGVENKTAVYYVNSNNGKTIFANGTEIDSVANRMTIFDGREMHAGLSCTDQQVRCIINFNYF